MFILGETSDHRRPWPSVCMMATWPDAADRRVAPSERRQGLGRQITVAALKWARLRGAATGWLQVEAHAPALALYADLGVQESYRYRYWRKEIAT